MITKEEYNKAKRVVENYEEQLRIDDVMRSKKLKEEQVKRELDCKEHYYLPDGKWTSTRSCQDCGKTI
jgi:hypothetical protein